MIKRTGRWFASKGSQYARVWRLLRKPTLSEFLTISKVSVVGIMIIGAIGFFVSVAMTLVEKVF